EVVAHGLSLATKRSLLRPPKAHLALFLVAAAVIAAPGIAADGSGATVASWPAGLRLIAVVVTAMLSQAGPWAEGYLVTGPVLYARGAVVGLGLGYGIDLALSDRPTQDRAWFGFVVGAAAFAGVDFLRDCLYAAQGRGRPRSWRVYLVQALLGGFVGAAIGF